ncbi:MAG TPA: FAD:protein FMN transferase [Deltaproteobacteria bacterium]|nr:FAD:protein FMN transferase [Deltaproteobacteria bacterium]
MKKTLPLIAVVLIALAFVLWRTRTPEVHTREVFVTDVFVKLTAQCGRESAEEAFKRAVDEIRRIDARLGYNNSLIDGLNRDHIVRDREVHMLLRVSKEVRDASSGAFSVTLKPILDAWGFTGSHPYRIPSEAEFSAWRKAPKDEAISLENDGVTVRIPAGMGIDIGGIIEGYAVDRAREEFLKSGCSTGLISVGGEVAAFGDRTWKIGIKHPRGEGVLAVVPLKNRAVATSGDYERFFLAGSKRYSHTLDPSTGWPARGVMSATVVAPTCTLANAWAVALFVAGPDRLGPVLDARGFDWIVVDGTGRVRTSRAMAACCPEGIY